MRKKNVKKKTFVQFSRKKGKNLFAKNLKKNI